MPGRPHHFERHLKLRDLRLLLTVARIGSMGKAAAQLALTQPAISKAIAEMELSLGVRLFDRDKRGVEPTIYARALLDRGTIALDELNQAVRHIDSLANPDTGEVRIASTIAIGDGFVSAVIERLNRQYPKIVVHLLTGEVSSMYGALDARSVDMVVAPVFPALLGEHFSVDVLYDEPLIVVAGKHSSWAKRRKICLADLANATWALPPLDSPYGRVVAEAFRANRLNIPNAAVFTSATPVRIALLATGHFLTIVQGSVAKFGERSNELKVLPIDLSTTRRPIGIIALKNRTIGPAGARFVECAHEVAARLGRS